VFKLSSSIVAVHGLNGHREKSWTDDQSGVLWLRDLLPHQLPNVRVLTFGYDADTLRLSGVSQLSLNDHATSLVEELVRCRSDPQVIRPNFNPRDKYSLMNVIYRLNADQSFSSHTALGVS
jgi:hypothetical protein